MDKGDLKLKIKCLKLKRLHRTLKGLGSVVVAYSGGLDSAFLLKAAIDSLGRRNVIAVTARSETYPASEYREAKEIARYLGARHITIDTSELRIENFKENPVNRCYYCKKELFTKINSIRKRYGVGYLVDGTNRDDLKDIRYGTLAAKELGVKSPLLECGITKDDIRQFSRRLNIPTWNKPSFACLASRIPFHSEITARDLKRIGLAEDYLRALGIKQVRVRLHGDIARLEVYKGEFAKAMHFKERIVKRLKQLGFVYVALDLAGYRTGSMHEMVAGTGLLRPSTCKPR